MKMKKLNILGISLMLILFAFFTSCESWIDPEINEDPNNPVDVGMEFILTAVQVDMAYDFGGNNAMRTTNIWMQYFDGVDRQSFTEAKYIYTSADCNNLWNSIYTVMNDIKDIIEKASVLDEDGNMLSPKMKGVAEVIFAEYLAVTTNLWGDIPYTEAFLGDENLHPTVDSQENIYVVIQALLDQAILDLQDESGTADIVGDLIFDGVESDWLATAWALKARYTLLLSEQNGATAYTNALTYADNALAAGFTGFVFNMFDEGGGTAEHPFTQFMDDRSGDIVMCATFMDYLVGNNDPRMFAVADGSEGYTGSTPSLQELGDLPGDYCNASESPVVLMSLSELKFIQAEALYVTSGANIDTTFEEAIMYSVIDMLNYAGLDPNNIYDVDLEATPPEIPTTAAQFADGYNVSSLEDIMEEKWVATHATVQGFNDWRRTGFPVLTVPANAVGVTPLRWIYPQEEVTYNTNISNVGVTIWQPLWWDI